MDRAAQTLHRSRRADIASIAPRRHCIDRRADIASIAAPGSLGMHRASGRHRRDARQRQMMDC
eukprot:5915427-Prymnesium_polylepis.2